MVNKDVSLFSRFWNDVPSGNMFGETMLNCDVEDLDDRYEISLEVPGVKKRDIDLRADGSLLRISWEFEREKRRGLGRKSRIERRSGSFSRIFDIPGADPGKISARLKNGVLSITAAKKEAFKTKHIEIA
jgi:HSP20 family protein